VNISINKKSFPRKVNLKTLKVIENNKKYEKGLKEKNEYRKNNKNLKNYLKLF